MITSAISTSSKHSELNRVQLLLKYTYGLVPIVAGLDKFTNVLTDWNKYLDPSIAHLLPLTASTFMMVVGVIEIVAGIIVLTKTELGAYIVAAWLTCIAFSLFISGNYFDVAVRDIVMAIGAFSLARLNRIKSEN
jgi:uncharacterized membrane protein YphA (DoxX/SURF4 family)